MHTVCICGVCVYECIYIYIYIYIYIIAAYAASWLSGTCE